jgi:hypothetical protein
VHVFRAIAALRQGVDPYAITFPDIRHGAYGPTSVSGRLRFGFPYFPFAPVDAGRYFLDRTTPLAAMETAAVL